VHVAEREVGRAQPIGGVALVLEHLRGALEERGEPQDVLALGRYERAAALAARQRAGGDAGDLAQVRLAHAEAAGEVDEHAGLDARLDRRDQLAGRGIEAEVVEDPVRSRCRWVERIHMVNLARPVGHAHGGYQPSVPGPPLKGPTTREVTQLP